MNKKDVCATKIAYVRFTEDDLADLDNQVRRVGASSRGAYIRSLIKGVRPVELPPADYVALIDELTKLRRSIDTMAARAADNKASALSPVEYYTLSSLTALTLQKIRLAALPQQYHLPEDMSHE
ncbi:bacterial mobilization protein [gut metagenome]|uniref:Bacterial mobilization protein n=1 Tax=gut metagenome TaxID=749906 RepID=J9GL80_9ZZZZ